MKRNLSIKQTADLLGSSTRTVYRLISDGELTALHVRGSLRIPEEGVEEYQRRQILKYAEENGIILDRICHGVPGKLDLLKPV